MLHGDRLVGVVELDRELDRQDRFRWRGCTAVGSNSICRHARLCPFRDYSDLAVDDVRHVGVAEGDAIPVCRRRGVGVQGAEGVCRIGVISMLAMVYSVLLRRFRVALEEERCERQRQSVSCGIADGGGLP